RHKRVFGKIKTAIFTVEKNSRKGGQQPKHGVRGNSKEKPCNKCKSDGGLEHITRQLRVYFAKFQVSCK
ncbi:hypothetical protein, partial [Acinetobacter baumannii]|uniref:hypothetical protein n=1 Tax=Acinetobacter baumannii TaxID=470 RepID=UPI00332ADCB7